jgi:FixJ family two-component response regulator
VIKPNERCVVYIVDDDDLVRKGLARLMRAGGFTPKTYERPELFLQELDFDTPACILLDITMPRMTGLQVQAKLKARGVTIPVIAVSARDDDETRLRARELDARCFFRKPVDDQALLDAISWVAQLRPDRAGAAGAGRAADGSESRTGPSEGSTQVDAGTKGQ